MHGIMLKECMPPQQLCDTFSKGIAIVDGGVFVLSTMLLTNLNNIIKFPLLVMLV